MAEGGTALQLCKAMGQLMLQRFNRLAEAFDAFRQLVGSHPVVLHQRIETDAINVNLGLTAAGMVCIQFSGQDRITISELIQQLG